MTTRKAIIPLEEYDELKRENSILLKSYELLIEKNEFNSFGNSYKILILKTSRDEIIREMQSEIERIRSNKNELSIQNSLLQKNSDNFNSQKWMYWFFITISVVINIYLLLR